MTGYSNADFYSRIERHRYKKKSGPVSSYDEEKEELRRRVKYLSAVLGNCGGPSAKKAAAEGGSEDLRRWLK